jgi:FkbM family methyltransferase
VRPQLFFNPRILCERLGIESLRRRRLAKLQNSTARKLKLGHIDSMELLELCKPLNISTVFDIGANVGTWSLLANAIFPRSQIHAFEPLDVCQRELSENLRDNPHFHVHQVALASKNGLATMHVGGVSDTSSLLPSVETDGKEPFRRYEQEVRSLDSYALEHALPPAHLLKLDVQGYELDILKGAAEVLSKTKAVICEVSFVEIYRRQCLFAELVEFMNQKNFSVRAFAQTTPTGVLLRQTDVLFLRNELDV